VGFPHPMLIGGLGGDGDQPASLPQTQQEQQQAAARTFIESLLDAEHAHRLGKMCGAIAPDVTMSAAGQELPRYKYMGIHRCTQKSNTQHSTAQSKCEAHATHTHNAHTVPNTHKIRTQHTHTDNSHAHAHTMHITQKACTPTQCIISC
jgi:hypothetical protein